MAIKMSISVPDDLLAQAKEATGIDSNSELVQRAFIRLLQDETARNPAGSALLAVSREKYAKSVAQEAKRMAEDRQLLHLEGYGAGIEFAHKLPWRFLDWLSALDWDIDRLRSQVFRAEDAMDPDDVYRGGSEGDLDEWIAEAGIQAFPPNTLGGDAVRDALRDVWNAVISAGDTPSAGGDAEPDAATK